MIRSQRGNIDERDCDVTVVFSSFHFHLNFMMLILTTLSAARRVLLPSVASRVAFTRFISLTPVFRAPAKVGAGATKASVPKKAAKASAKVKAKAKTQAKTKAKTKAKPKVKPNKKVKKDEKKCAVLILPSLCHVVLILGV